MSDLQIKLPEKVYVGFNSRPSQDEVPLGFMTPWGTDQAALKRIATVDRWAKGYNASAPLDPVTLDNIAMTGFRIGRSVTRRSRWSGSSTMVRIEDPRGFELEISVDNLTSLMSNNITQNGEIIQECIWGRSGKDNILLAVNSQPYLDALENNKRAVSKVSGKEVKPGFDVTLKDGTVGKFLGKLYVTAVTDNRVLTHDTQYFGVKVDDTVHLYATKPQFAYVHNAVNLTSQEIDSLIFKSNVAYTGSWGKRPTGKFVCASTGKPDITSKFVPLPSDVKQWLKDRRGYRLVPTTSLRAIFGGVTYAVSADSLSSSIDAPVLWSGNASSYLMYGSHYRFSLTKPSKADLVPASGIDGSVFKVGSIVVTRASLNDSGTLFIEPEHYPHLLDSYHRESGATTRMPELLKKGIVGVLDENHPIECSEFTLTTADGQQRTIYPVQYGI